MASAGARQAPSAPGAGSSTGSLPASVTLGSQASTSPMRVAEALALVKTTTRFATYTIESRVWVM